MSILNAKTLIALGLKEDEALHYIEAEASNRENYWRNLSQKYLKPSQSFELHYYIFTTLFPEWPHKIDSAPAFIPDQQLIETSNVYQMMQKLALKSLTDLHHFSVNNFESFWDEMISTLNIQFKHAPRKICELENYESPHWLKDALMNITDSCFNAPADAIAIYEYQNEQAIKQYSFSELKKYSNRIANSLLQHQFKPGDAIAIMMPMNFFAIAIYLGIIKMGGIVVSIADSFSSKEIETRCDIANVKAIFTQDFMQWGNKKIALYQKILNTNLSQAIVLPLQTEINIELRNKDLDWRNFLSDNEDFSATACEPMSACNILFSSGTTAEPKAIVWNHTTPIKCASDAFFHQNIQAKDVLCWPTNLGWMMGPWLIFAAFINQAAIALYPNIPKSREFCRFVQDAKVTMLGVVPTLVTAWRHDDCLSGFDFKHIKVFSSTGECSNASDMFYLQSRACYKPIIEYCGGTEIGGAYISSTVIQKNYPSLFSTKVIGVEFKILDENGNESNIGEVAIQPPSLGLSTILLNADHHQIYFANMPYSNQIPLRRHGDQIMQFQNGYYAILGRVDDTMNLGAIKVSAAEIERTLANLPDVLETAAIGIAQQGPTQLIVYVASNKLNQNKIALQQLMQQRINSQLNPLFKIADIVIVSELPKTASNKIMRRELRKKYLAMKAVS